MARPLSLGRLSIVFLRVANFTFGGGDPSMAVLYSELVQSHGWLSAEKYGLAYALARITPGTNLLAFSAAAAWQLLGWRGALAGVLAMSLPPAAAVLLLTGAYEAWKSNAGAMAAIAATLAAALGMMAAGGWLLVRPHLTKACWARAVVVAGGSVLLSLGADLPPVPVLGLAALAGFFWRIPKRK
jgi:chromate transporter